MYSTESQNSIELLDTLDIKNHPGETPVALRADPRTGRIYLPCRSRGVWLVNRDESKLKAAPALKQRSDGVAVASSNQICVCDCTWNNRRVCFVGVDKIVDQGVDKIIVDEDSAKVTLNPPNSVKRGTPRSVAVIGETILVWYGDRKKLVLYRQDHFKEGKLIPLPDGLKSVCSLATDNRSRFLLVDDESYVVFVLDIAGKLDHTIQIPHGSGWQPKDCTVVGTELWVGCGSGDIVVLSSQLKS